MALREAGDQDKPASSLADSDSRFTSVEGVLVHFKQWGGSDAPVQGNGVLLLHGFGAGAFAWRLVAPQLARRCPGARVVAFDRTGFGCAQRAHAMLPPATPHSWPRPSLLAG